MKTLSPSILLRPALRSCLVLLCALPLLANAHYIWIERDAKTARIYFGEVAEVREQSPGRLDEIKAPRAWALATDVRGVPAKPIDLAVKREPRYFSLSGTLTQELLATETGYMVKDWSASGIGIVKPMYYARHSSWPLKQALAPAKELKLDVQPVAGTKGTFVVLFDGKPLANNKVVIYAPNDWEQEHKTDERGQVKMALPWRGQYVVEAIYKEALAGEFEGQKFDAVRHRATLTVVQPGGLNPRGTGGGASGPGMMKGNTPMLH